MRRARAGFSLLEVIVALGILVTTLVILVEIQSSAADTTLYAERVIVATDLAQAKLEEAQLRVEEDGFQIADIEESGDFSDFGDDAGSVDFRDELEGYRWEYSIAEIDLALAGDIAAMAQELDGSGFFGGGGGGDEITPLPGNGGGADLAASGLSQIGLSPDALTEMIGPYIREVRVRVWWGEDSKAASEAGNEVVLTSHAINPTGVLAMDGGLPQ